jgi:hypothetical protein
MNTLEIEIINKRFVGYRKEQVEEVLGRNDNTNESNHWSYLIHQTWFGKKYYLNIEFLQNIVIAQYSTTNS